MKRREFLKTAASAAVVCGLPQRARAIEYPFRDPSLPRQRRIDDLIGRLTLSEKVAQLNNQAPAIARLGIPAYDWWSEALHGIAREGYATVFPQAIGMAATWNPDLIKSMGDAVSTEARAKYNATGISADHQTYNGLTVFSPNINIFRDPRWGRGQETFGEDPFLTSRFAVEYVQGLQGHDSRYLKVAATAKHFAVHSGPEKLRHVFNVDVDEKTLNEFYLYAFRAVVKEGGVESVMSAYNALNGTPCAANAHLLQTVLRDSWGFKGYVVCDCGGVWDMVEERHIEPDFAHAAAAAMAAGVDLCCGDDYLALTKSVQQTLTRPEQIDNALRRLLDVRFRLGMFDPPATVPYDAISPWEIDTHAHAQLALRIAHESLVLLKNDGLLPLRKSLAKVAVIGPNADSVEVLLGDYEGTPTAPVTIFEGIRAKLPGAQVACTQGCDYVTAGDDAVAQREQALAFARDADVVIFAGGIGPQLEGEENPSEKAEGFDQGDRTRIEIPAIQTQLLQALHATGKPVVLVLLSGSALAFPWEAEHLTAIVQAWYPGQSGGTAVADVLFGDYNPAGRLPVTFFASTEDLPPFEDYRLTNRTYRYFSGKPLFAFGHGLSYTRFRYSNLGAQAPRSAADSIRLHFDIANEGTKDGDEVVQIYVRDLEPQRPHPISQLCGFERVRLRKGESRMLAIEIPPERFAYWDNRGTFAVAPGSYELLVGASSADIRLRTQIRLE